MGWGPHNDIEDDEAGFVGMNNNKGLGSLEMECFWCHVFLCKQATISVQFHRYEDTDR